MCFSFCRSTSISTSHYIYLCQAISGYSLVAPSSVKRGELFKSQLQWLTFVCFNWKAQIKMFLLNLLVTSVGGGVSVWLQEFLFSIVIWMFCVNLSSHPIKMKTEVILIFMSETCFKKYTGCVLFYQMNLLYNCTVSGEKLYGSFCSLDAGFVFQALSSVSSVIVSDENDICDSSFTPALLWQPGGAQSRPPTASWGGHNFKKKTHFTANVESLSALPELGIFFGDDSNLQLSSPEVHIEDRGQAWYRQLEENEYVQ